ncbi:hypothetical protein [Corynebacterium casei]|uniref:hypothetical protein n=2 Tax=Corynebacterium casei TaxID=160386 RepID=UPI003FD4C43F
MPIQISSIGRGGSEVPVNELQNLDDIDVPNETGASRWRHPFKDGTFIDTLLINQESDVLVVSFHGALNRKTYEIPRFERVATLAQTPYSSLFISDPALWLDETLQLAWYTGWGSGPKLDSILAPFINEVAKQLGVKTIILSGSSGGGFASLQVSSLIPGSYALAFNPQTHVHGYHDSGKPTDNGAVRKYIEVLYPEAAPNGIWKIDFSVDWTEELDDRFSPIRRYKTAQDNFIVYCNNLNDWHVEQHYQPFEEAFTQSAGKEALRTINYNGKQGHHPPNASEFMEGLNSTVHWARENQ